MPKTKPVQVFKDDSVDLETRIIKAISAVGPRNVALISRMTGAHQETIRYKIKRQFLNRGFRFQAEVDYSKLGLGLSLVKFKLTPVYYDSAPRLFRALSAHSFLFHFSKDLPSGDFTTFFAVPFGKGELLRGLLEILKDDKIVDDFEAKEVAVERHKPFDPTYFNFQAGSWEIDWHKVDALPAAPLTVAKRLDRVDVDPFDLVLVRELQRDALQHVVGMSRNLKANAKTMEYHYRTHVVRKKLIPGYRVRWMKDLDKVSTHTMVFTRYTFRGLSSAEFRSIQESVNRIPYLWVENLLVDGDYMATFCIPTPDFVEANSYISRTVGSLGRRAEMGILKTGEAASFPIPAERFIDGAWDFDPEKMNDEVVRELANVEK